MTGAGPGPEVGDQLSPAALMAAAAERAGGDVWGDRTFVAPLTVLLQSSLETGRLSARGEAVLRSVALRHLRNRLDLQAYLDRRPQAAAAELGAPVVVTGLPRTATSLLHNLLSQDPRHRYLPLARALHPAPVPDEAALREQAERWLERFYAMVPAFRAIHPLVPDGPEECDALLQNAFASLHFDDMFDAEGYSRWFHESRLESAYDYYALQLRVLTAGPEAGRRWILKSPGHLGHLDALVRALPGARILHCHRDLARAVPSYASLILAVRTPNSDTVDPERIGDQALWRTATAMRRALDARGGLPDGVVFDVSFAELVADPLDLVKRIYRWLETPLEPGAEAAMRRWMAENPPDRHGTHEYDPAYFGLSAARIEAEFRAYLDQFEALAGVT